MSISDRDYNHARAILVQAGSNPASKSHDKHNRLETSGDCEISAGGT